MQRLYAPWRDEYVTSKQSGCPFCYALEHPSEDEQTQVLYRSKNAFLIINKYPYTPGHFMVIPNMHIDNIESLPSEVWLEMSELVQKSVRLLKSGFGVHGVNIGMNLGEQAGAGIASHVHYHIVPRWSRDTNFITTISACRVYSTDFEQVYHKLKSLIDQNF